MSRGQRISFNPGPKHLDPKELHFGVFTAEEIKKLSVSKIEYGISFNELGHPIEGGVYDPAMGAIGDGLCSTCGNNAYYCAGHFGHIELPVPVVNPLFHKTLCTLMKLCCHKCRSLQLKEYEKKLLFAKVQLLEEGFFCDLEGLEQEIATAVAHHEDEVKNNNFPTKTSEDEDTNEIPSPLPDLDDYIEEIINNYVQTLRNKDPSKSILSSLIDTKSNNMQWQIYIESTLKQLVKRTDATKKCIFCGEKPMQIFTLKQKIMIKQQVPGNENDGDANSSQVVNKTESVPLLPETCQKIMQEFWKAEKSTLKILFSCFTEIEDEYPTDILFFKMIPVLPPVSRPVNILGGRIIEHPQSNTYKKIAQDAMACGYICHVMEAEKEQKPVNLHEEAVKLYNLCRGSNSHDKLYNMLESLQANVDHLMDRELNKTADSVNCQGLKQILEKKEGVIRMHMMGKRVNFAARSVITPDPNLNIDEVGIPDAFAKKLTYPEPVTARNVTELREMVLNGPDIHPGAVLLENDDGRVIRLSSDNDLQRQAIAKSLLTRNQPNRLFPKIKFVHRHLMNGDILLLNRQPTLHKPSIMAHKARILKGEKTIRMHYANCKAYNADFDGDEMNVHFPQTYHARSEGYYIANVSNQYLVPKDGTPLSGLIQDHVIGGVRLTLRGQFFDKQDYMQLVFSALSMVKGTLVLLPPSIMKPKALWSGKQVVSTVIQNIIPHGQNMINLKSKAKIDAKAWQVNKPRRWNCGQEFSDSKTMSEQEVIIRKGELLSGILDKTHYGATPFGFIHCIFELYGHECANKMLSAFGKLFQAFLQLYGFTLGIQDILIKKENDAKRKEIIAESRKVGEEIQRSVLELGPDTPREVVVEKLDEHYMSNPLFRAQIDHAYKSKMNSFTDDINKTCLPMGLIKKFPDNNLQLMVQSGAKGSTVNTTQISCLLGQIELEGKRPPLMISGKSLPSFVSYDPTPRAGGYIDGRFMTGIRPQEFFFHCMAGREGLIDTAVKTSRSGYLQRCLIKHLEGLVVQYDNTVRDSDGSLIQMAYGEDGLDVSKSRFLRKEQLDFLVENNDIVVNEQLVNQLKQVSDTRKIHKLTKKINKWEKKNGDSLIKRRISPFTKYTIENPVNAEKYKKMMLCGRTKGTFALMKKWVNADEETRNKYINEVTRCPDPVMSQHRPDLEFGVLPEQLEKLLNDYRQNGATQSAKSMEKNELRDLLSAKVIKSLCAQGEPVGLLAAQSIGEPSTQMTLNTFHFAGRGEMNVTLGIPRLREILMMASKKIKTPSMDIPFRQDLPKLAKQTEKLRLKLTRCVVMDVLESMQVDRVLKYDSKRQLVCTLNLKFLPHKSIKKEFYIHPRDIIKKTENLFFKQIFREIKKWSKKENDAYLEFKEKKANLKGENLSIDEKDEENEADKSQGKLELGESHESSDEEEMPEDADATTLRTVSRHRENQEYEDPEDEELDDMEQDGNEQQEKERDSEDENAFNTSDSHDISAEIAERKLDVVDNLRPYALSYDYDSKHHSWCKLEFYLPLAMAKLHLPEILRAAAKNVVLWEIPGIKRAFVNTNKNGDKMLKTDGINIEQMFMYNEILDLNRLYSNDIHAIAQTYGIEAANKVMVKEVKEVFAVYGITVDPRHLSLIADYMTFDGAFQPLNRKGMENSASPLQQMSFESSLIFLKNAVMQAKKDDLQSPSSRLMVGKPVKCGTGMFQVLTKVI